MLIKKTGLYGFLISPKNCYTSYIKILSVLHSEAWIVPIFPP